MIPMTITKSLKFTQYIFKMMRNAFKVASTNHALRNTTTVSFCNTTITQYEKILEKNNNKKDGEISQKCITEYTKEDIRFTKHFKSRCLGTDTITPLTIQILREVKSSNMVKSSSLSIARQDGLERSLRTGNPTGLV
ncbi:MAG: hypothetical protein EXX96DRAFT_543037 [Benjaminiella poitrasii]|nr:MAG: hypothetical protein EXX96DRAFT_543037 [Benjaminiella poitrasii]